MATEQTLIVVKPDGFKRHLTGKILARFEQKGFQIRDLKLYNFTKEKAQEFYSAHKEKAFFEAAPFRLVIELTTCSTIC